ncbi:four helix bundle protein [Lewinella marina]|uniref:Four helix bundle protein n=1 Tax=Neolewinella marina TaxID=438751 RepID=A0A2G0CIN9_9BACT|nr:four helix bundle protein [Neolewinella marina]NJB85079.1 four helix bundle protein [Neolewinella marina]PHK99780.1 four helix bundle protein [Neolewinella marina]
MDLGEDDLPEPEESFVFREPESTYGSNSSERIRFVNALRTRTKVAAVAVIDFLEMDRPSLAMREVSRQLIRSATSTAANYRAACLARSGREFYAKMSIVVEEADETVFWLEILYESRLKVDKESLIPLGREWREISKIMSKARSSYRNKKA